MNGIWADRLRDKNCPVRYGLEMFDGYLTLLFQVSGMVYFEDGKGMQTKVEVNERVYILCFL